MNKTELAAYLADLLTLMSAQDASGVHQRSQTLGAEYNKHWDLLKEAVKKEHEDDERSREDTTLRRDES